MQDAGARLVSNAEGMRGIVRKHDCALPAQYTKHSNARGHSLILQVRILKCTLFQSVVCIIAFILNIVDRRLTSTGTAGID